jgi:hypothetical protein
MASKFLMVESSNLPPVRQSFQAPREHNKLIKLGKFVQIFTSAIESEAEIHHRVIKRQDGYY